MRWMVPEGRKRGISAGARFAALAVGLTLLPTLVASVGCREEVSITATSARRTAPPRPMIDPDSLASTFDHMLTAIIMGPQPDTAGSEGSGTAEGDAGASGVAPAGRASEAWFLKVTTSRRQLDRLRPAWDALLSSLKFQTQGGATRLTWELPEGWREEAGGAMREATLKASVDGAEVELSVTRLPITGSFDNYLTANVNRWLGQLQQDPLDGETLAQLIDRRQLAGAPAAIVELRGVLDQSALPMGHPRVGGPGSRGNVAGGDAAAVGSSPAGSATNLSTGGAAGAEADAPLQFAAPPGWKPGRLSMARLAAFEASDSAGTAEVTVTSFASKPGSSMADPQVNAERWAGQLGAELDAEGLQDRLRPIEIDGRAGTLFDMATEADGALEEGMLVAMVELEGKVFFFKMMGSRETVRAQREAFDAFLGSVSFGEGEK